MRLSSFISTSISRSTVSASHGTQPTIKVDDAIIGILVPSKEQGCLSNLLRSAEAWFSHRYLPEGVFTDVPREVCNAVKVSNDTPFGCGTISHTRTCISTR
jgi:hypothetical protein